MDKLLRPSPHELETKDTAYTLARSKYEYIIAPVLTLLLFALGLTAFHAGTSPQRTMEQGGSIHENTALLNNSSAGYKALAEPAEQTTLRTLQTAQASGSYFKNSLLQNILARRQSATSQIEAAKVVTSSVMPGPQTALFSSEGQDLERSKNVQNVQIAETTEALIQKFNSLDIASLAVPAGNAIAQVAESVQAQAKTSQEPEPAAAATPVPFVPENVPPVAYTELDDTAPALIAVNYAKAQLGKPYVWGGNGPYGYDCSGLVMMAYRQAGIYLPRTADDQLNSGVPVYNLLPGDLVFALDPADPNYYPGEQASHVGIWDGNYIVNAANPDDGIIRDSFSSWWRTHFVGARRIPGALQATGYAPQPIPATAPIVYPTATPKPRATATPKPIPTATKVPAATPTPTPNIAVAPPAPQNKPSGNGVERFNMTVAFDATGTYIIVYASSQWTGVSLTSSVPADVITLVQGGPVTDGYQWRFKVKLSADKSHRTYSFWSNGLLLTSAAP